MASTLTVCVKSNPPPHNANTLQIVTVNC